MKIDRSFTWFWSLLIKNRSSHQQMCSIKKCVLKNFIKKETLAQVFSHEFCKMFKSTTFLQNSSGWLLLKEMLDRVGGVGYFRFFLNLFWVWVHLTNKITGAWAQNIFCCSEWDVIVIFKHSPVVINFLRPSFYPILNN